MVRDTDKPAPKRRWFQWSLRTLFVAVTALCLLIPWGINNWRQVRQRETMFRAFAARGASLGPVFPPGVPVVNTPAKPIPFMWWLLGAEDPGGDIWLPHDKFTEEERSDLQALFPDVDVILWEDQTKPPEQYRSTHPGLFQ